MTDEVDSDQSDFNGGTSRGTKFHLELWLPIFFTMEVLVMLVSFALNVMLLRAVAKNRLKETPVYMFIMWLFFTKLVDDAVIIGQFLKYQQPNYSHTTTLCQVWPPTQFFRFLFCKKIVCLEDKLMTPRLGNTFLFHSYQQLNHPRLGPLRGYLKCQGPFKGSRLASCVSS